MILNIILKSLNEAVKPQRFLPFFLLYFIFSLSTLIFAMPVLFMLPSFLSLQFSKIQLAVTMINIVGFFIVFLIVILLNLWFTGALVFDLFKNKGFDKALKYSQKLYWQILILSLFIFIISSFASFVRGFGIILGILIDWVFTFSLPILIIKKTNFKIALSKSYKIVRKRPIQTFVFWLAMNIVNLLIIFVTILFVTFFASPLILDIMELLPLMKIFTTITNQKAIEIINLVLISYPTLMVLALILSFFIALSHVFRYNARTYYFLKLKRR